MQHTITKNSNHNPAAILAVNAIVLFLLVFIGLILPVNIASKIAPYNNIVISLLSLLIVIIIHLSNSLQRKKIPFSYFDVAAIGFVILNFLSWLWANQPALIWQKSFAFLQLYLIFKILQLLDLSLFKKRLFEITIITISISNCLFIAYLFINSMIKADGFYLLYQDIELVTKNLFSNANFNSSLLVLLLPLLLFIQTKSIILYVLAAIQIGIILLFNARASSLSLICLGIFLISTFYSKGQIKKTIKLGTIILVVILSLIFTIGEKEKYFFKYVIDNPFEEQTNNERLKLWQNSILLFKEKPILGQGTGNWPIEHLKYGSSQYKLSFNKNNSYKHAHNLYFESLAELGIVGFGLLFICFFITVIKYFNTNDSQIKLLFSFAICFFVLANFYGIVYPNVKSIPPHSVILAAAMAVFFVDEKFKINSKLISTLTLIFSIICFFWYSYELSIFNKITKAKASKKQVQLERAFRSIYKTGITEYYRNQPIKILIAQSLYKQNKKEKALNNFNMGISKDPYNYKWHNRLAFLYDKSKKKKKALKSYQNAYQLNNNIFNTNIWLAKNVGFNNLGEIEQYLSFYNDWLKPLKEKHYNESVWNNEASSNTIKYWSELCTLEDKVVDLYHNNGITIINAD